MRANNCRNGCKRLHINDYKYYTFMKHCLLFFFLSLPVLATWAAPVTRRQAYAQAENFFAAHGITLKAGAKAFAAPQASTADGTTAAYYVFNAGGDKGFAIVSGDDRTEPVLGYALHGSVSEDNMPDNMRWWLGEYARQIKYIQENDINATTAKGTGSDREHIAEMMVTKWNQTAPFNNACPKVGGRYESVTGCVATAMAQVLYYEYQRHGSTITQTTTADIPAYTCHTVWNGITTNVAAVEKNTPIDWQDMLPLYGSSAIDTQKEAVANLMLWCGAAVQTNYGPASNGGSSASSTRVAEALVNHFGFDASTRYVSRDASYTNRQWNDVVYNELANGRVVFYGGQSSKGSGHAFVIDGYDKDNFFYVNWGWGGTGDGAYLLSVLSPDGTGTGAGDVGSGYSQDQSMVIYAETDHGGVPAVRANARDFTRSGNILSYKLHNIGTATASFKYGFGTVDANGIITTRTTKTSANLESNHYLSNPVTFDLSTLGDGTYDVVPIATEGTETLYQSLWPTGHAVRCTVYKGKVTFGDTGTPQLSATNLAASGQLTAGRHITVTATINNSGDGDYEGVLYLFASTTDKHDSPAVATAQASVTAGGTAELTFDWTPLAEGAYTLWLSSNEDCATILSSTTVTVDKGNGIYALTLKSMTVENTDGTPTTDSDGRTLTIVSGNDLKGSYTLTANQTIAAGTHFTTFLLKYNEQTGMYDDYNKQAYPHGMSTSYFNQDMPSGYTFAKNFVFTNLPDGKYIVRPEVGTLKVTTYYYMQPELWYDDSHVYAIGTATGIGSPSLDSNRTVNVYNLHGVKVATISIDKINTLPHGLYIVNGKKVVVK